MVAQNREAYKLYQDSFKDLGSKFAAGALNQESYKAQTHLVATEVAKTLGNTSDKAVDDIKSAMFPSWKDFNGSKGEKFQKADAFFAGNEGKATTLRRLGLLKPFPKGGTGKGKYPEGTVKGGHVVKGGKWVPTGASKQATK